MKRYLLVAVMIIAVCLTLAACKCEHQYEEKIAVEASCTAVGQKRLTCTLCQESHTEEIPMKEHSYVNVVKDATCTSEGKESTVCSECDYVLESKEIAKLDHQYRISTFQSATCNNEGVDLHKCTKCGDEQYNATTKLGHTTYKGICKRCYNPVGLSATEIQKHIQVLGMRVDEPNSAGGCSFWIYFKNTSDKEIKYITFTVSAYNGVKDPVNCQIRGYHTVSIKDTGPYKAGESRGETWRNVWYNPSIKYYKLEMITIEYMDGTFLIIGAENAEKTFDPYAGPLYGKQNHI